MSAPVAGSAQIPAPRGDELLAGVLLGTVPGSPRLPDPAGRGVRAALELAVLPALQRPPCVVSFSGGRDSSAILAVALDAARRHGLPEPIAATKRYPAVPGSDEQDWQELVLGHLQAGRHEVVELHEELDALGPVAAEVVRRCGVRWPANAYMHVPLFELARGGSLLTGIGGDELLASQASSFVRAAFGRHRPALRDAASLGYALLPRRLRAAVRARQPLAARPWLTRSGERQVAHALAAEEAAWPRRWDRSIAYWRTTRAYAASAWLLEHIAAPWDVRVTSPLLEPGVLAELAHAGGAAGFVSRTAAMRELFADLLPVQVLEREGKATFGPALWGPEARRFARTWDGSGLDPGLVDVEALRREWLAPEPHFATLLLMHAAWNAPANSG